MTVGTGCPWKRRSGASGLDRGQLHDPQLNLAFFGVGQTYDTGPMLHSINQPGITSDSLYTDSTLALNPDTGTLAWHFQHVHNDQWDLDWAFEQEVIELPVNGTPRKLVVTSGKMGIIEAMDAATGQYLFSKDVGLQNIVTGIDPKIGRKEHQPRCRRGRWQATHHLSASGGGRKLERNVLQSGHQGALCADGRVVHGPRIPAGPRRRRGNLSSGYNWSHPSAA